MDYREKRLMADDIHCHNKDKADIRFHDGALPHAIGACCYQVVRASKNPDLSPEGYCFTYNHAAMLSYFNGKFLYEYLGGPNGEHEAPSAVFLCTSDDGIYWEKPQEIFPAIWVAGKYYRGPKKECIQSEMVPCITHQRMGFYTASNGRQLVMTFYGISPDFHTAPNNGYGVGRAVREIYRDFSMSPVYFLRYNLPGGYNQDNTKNFPYYEESEDTGFVEACWELLENRLVTQQWWEEERLDVSFFTRPGGRALSYYTLDDGRVMGVFKDSLTSFSDDHGEHWSPMKKSLSIETSSGKVWGQKTPDGRYALVYNPASDSAHRWPLAVITGDDGVNFDHLAAIVPEISPCRYEGALKNLGAQYMRGITEANSYPKDQALWVAYSVNKEDMWIARVPVPVREEAAGEVADCLKGIEDGYLRDNWNLYVPAWNSARIGKKGLCLKDCDPYDRTRATRMLQPGYVVNVRAKITVEQLVENRIAVLLQDRRGSNMVSVVICPDGKVCLHQGGLDTTLCSWSKNVEIEISVTVDCVENKVKAEAFCGGSNGMAEGYAAASVTKVERVVFATKYELPWQGLEANGRNGDIGNLTGADEKLPETVFYVEELITRNMDSL